MTALTLSDVIEAYAVRDLMTAFHEATKLPIAVFDPQQRVLAAVGWQDICMLFHHTTARAIGGLCQEADRALAGRPASGSYLQFTCRFGLTDVGFPIMVGGERLGTMFIGQFLLQPPDKERFTSQAEDYGFDRNAYLAALENVEVVRKEHEPTIKGFVDRLVGLLAGLVGESRARASAEARLEVTDGELERRIRERTRDLHALVESLAQQASHDDLTGLWNRRHLNELLRMEIARSRRSGAPFTLLAIDLDRLKVLNDCYGHQEGDRALVQVAAILAEQLRGGDVIARWGGDEFVALLPATDLANGTLVSDRLCRAVERAGGAPGQQLTVSIGVAQWQDETADSLLKRCDAACYEAKRRGRNRSVALPLSIGSGTVPPQRQAEIATSSPAEAG